MCYCAEMSCYFQTALYTSLYKVHRFDYPKTVYDRILSFMDNGSHSNNGRWKLAVDVGCGTGLSTGPLAEYFDEVIGVDSSETQLEEAKLKHAHLENVTFLQGRAEDLKCITDDSVDLVTTAAALHWFDQNKFYRECGRILRPGGVFAAFTFGWEDENHPASQFVKEDLKDYLSEGERRVINLRESRGKTIDYCLESSYFSHVERDDTISFEREMTIDDWCGFMKTVPAWHKYQAMNPDKPDPMIHFTERMQRLYASNSSIPVKYWVNLLFGRK